MNKAYSTHTLTALILTLASLSAPSMVRADHLTLTPTAKTHPVRPTKEHTMKNQCNMIKRNYLWHGAFSDYRQQAAARGAQVRYNWLCRDTIKNYRSIRHRLNS